jgi:hypothetical protein
MVRVIPSLSSGHATYTTGAAVLGMIFLIATSMARH